MPLSQNGAKNRDLRCVLHRSTFRFWVQNTSRIQNLKGFTPIYARSMAKDRERGVPGVLNGTPARRVAACANATQERGLVSLLLF